MKYWIIFILTLSVFAPLEYACQYTYTYSDSITISVGDFYQEQNLPVGMALYHADITLTNTSSQVCYFFHCPNTALAAPYLLRELINDQWIETPFYFICDTFGPQGYITPIQPGESILTSPLISDHLGFFAICFRWAFIESQTEGEIFYTCSSSFQITSDGTDLVQEEVVTRPFLNSSGQFQFENKLDNDVILTVSDAHGCLVGRFLASSNSTLVINDNFSSGMYIITQSSTQSGFLNSTKIFKP